MSTETSVTDSTGPSFASCTGSISSANGGNVVVSELEEGCAYEVDKLLKCKLTKDGPLFLVQWKDHQKSESTWEKFENLICPRLREYASTLVAREEERMRRQRFIVTRCVMAFSAPFFFWSRNHAETENSGSGRRTVVSQSMGTAMGTVDAEALEKERQRLETTIEAACLQADTKDMQRCIYVSKGTKPLEASCKDFRGCDSQDGGDGRCRSTVGSVGSMLYENRQEAHFLNSETRKDGSKGDLATCGGKESHPSTDGGNKGVQCGICDSAVSAKRDESLLFAKTGDQALPHFETNDRTATNSLGVTKYDPMADNDAKCSDDVTQAVIGSDVHGVPSSHAEKSTSKSCITVDYSKSPRDESDAGAELFSGNPSSRLNHMASLESGEVMDLWNEYVSLMEEVKTNRLHLQKEKNDNSDCCDAVRRLVSSKESYSLRHPLEEFPDRCVGTLEALQSRGNRNFVSNISTANQRPRRMEVSRRKLEDSRSFNRVIDFKTEFVDEGCLGNDEPGMDDHRGPSKMKRNEQPCSTCCSYTSDRSLSRSASFVLASDKKYHRTSLPWSPPYSNVLHPRSAKIKGKKCFNGTQRSSSAQGANPERNHVSHTTHANGAFEICSTSNKRDCSGVRENVTKKCSKKHLQSVGNISNVDFGESASNLHTLRAQSSDSVPKGSTIQSIGSGGRQPSRSITQRDVGVALEGSKVLGHSLRTYKAGV